MSERWTADGRSTIMTRDSHYSLVSFFELITDQFVIKLWYILHKLPSCRNDLIYNERIHNTVMMVSRRLFSSNCLIDKLVLL